MAILGAVAGWRAGGLAGAMTYLIWEGNVEAELLRLADEHALDFEAMSRELRRAIRLETLRVKTSTRHAVAEFTADACRLKFAELEGGDMPHDDAASSSAASPSAKETPARRGSKEGASVPPVPAQQRTSSPRSLAKSPSRLEVLLGLDDRAEDVLAGLPRQEDGGASVTELGEIIRILETQGAKTPARDVSAFEAFTVELAKMELPPMAGEAMTKGLLEEEQAPKPQPQAQLQQQAQTQPQAQTASSSAVAASLRSARKPLRRGTREEVFEAVADAKGDDGSDGEDDWRATRQRIKQQAGPTR